MTARPQDYEPSPFRKEDSELLRNIKVFYEVRFL